MTDDQIDTQLRRAAADEPPPAFSPTLHERLMDGVRHAARPIPRDPVRRIYWRAGIVAAVAASVAVAVGIALWHTQPPPQPVPPVPRPVASAHVFSVPDEAIARGALRAQDGIDALVANSELASLDDDAVNLTRFVLDQLSSAAPPAGRQER